MNFSNTHRRLMSAVLGLALILTSANALQAQTVPSEKRLPKNVYAYISVPNVDQFKEKWTNTQFGKLLRDPAMADFLADFTENFTDKIAEFEDQINMPLADLAGIPSGDLTLAVMRPPRSTVAFAVMLDFKDSGDAVDNVLKQVSEGLSKEGAQEDAYEYADTRVVTFTIPTDDDVEGQAKPNMAYFLRDKHLVMGSSKPAIEAILDRWDGKNENNFTTNDIYSQMMATCTKGMESPAIKWYINPIDLTRAALAAAGPDAMSAQMAMGFLPTLGLDGLKAIGGAGDMGTGDFDSISKYMIYVRKPTRAVMNVFQMPATVQKPPAWIPANASAYVAFNWDIQGAYDAIESLVDSFRGPGATRQSLDGLAETTPGNIHIKDDIVDMLNGKFIVGMMPGNDPEVIQDRLIFSIGVKDTKKANSLMQTVSEMPTFDGEVREFQGTKIFEFDADFTGQDPHKGGLVVAEDALMFGSHVELIEGVIRGADASKSLESSGDYKRFLSKVPEKTSMISYQKQDAQIEQIYGMLKSEEIFDEAGGAEIREVIGDIDFSKLPPFEELKKYFTPTGSYLVPDENGALIVGFSLKPEK